MTADRAKRELERLIYTCERNADEWRKLEIPFGDQHEGEADQWQQVADELRAITQKFFAPAAAQDVAEEKKAGD